MSSWQQNKEERSLAYAEKRRDPRWQKMRLTIMERDEWSCQICYSKTVTLNVHHLYYENGSEPWEYPDAALLTLCEQCHTEQTEVRPFIEKQLLLQLKKKGFMSWDLEALASAFSKFPDGVAWSPLAEIIRYTLTDPVMVDLISKRYFAHIATRVVPVVADNKEASLKIEDDSEDAKANEASE